jgi:hypothetical protein
LFIDSLSLFFSSSQSNFDARTYAC